MIPLEIHNGSLREPIPRQLLGSAVLDQTGEFEAGSYQSFTLTYTAGRFGIDDSGSIPGCVSLCNRPIKPPV